MPTVMVIDGYRLFFYSNEGQEPPHIHVEKGAGRGKWWLRPVAKAWSSDLKKPAVVRAHRIVVEHQERLIEAWNAYFGE